MRMSRMKLRTWLNYFCYDHETKHAYKVRSLVIVIEMHVT